ncbi:MAG: hypothetical protein KF777_24080, partial [Planctomycetaceae bacterium]|nr:hypothetical protein [Planctomycetaceae bacterium]
YDEFRFDRDRDGHLAHSVASKVAYKQVGDHLEIVTGCVERVIQRLTEAGYEVTVNDLGNCSHDPVQINASVLSDTEAVAPGLAEVLRAHRSGVLECKDRRRADIVGCLCQLFWPARIFIAFKTNEAAQSMVAGLSPYLGGGVEAVHGLNWTFSCRVVCGTFQSLNRSNPADWKILVFADAHEGIQATNNDALGDYCHHCLYAFDNPRKRRSPEEQLRMEILAGAVIYRDRQLPRQHTTEFVAAFMSHASSGGQPSTSTRDRRTALRGDDRRNHAIAKVARAFAQGTEAPLWDHKLVLDEKVIASLGPQPGVVIVVDSVQHGEQLRRHLPDWQLFHGQPRGDQTAAQGIAISTWGVPRNSIVTAIVANKLVGLDARIVIWASGGSAPFIPIILKRSRQTQLLIDVWDDGNPLLAADTRQRLEIYRSLGCRVLGNNLIRREQVLTQEIESRNSNTHRNTSRRRRRSQRPSV